MTQSMTKTTPAMTMNANRDQMMIDLMTNEDGSVSWVWEAPHGVAFVGTASSEQEALEAAVNAHQNWYHSMH